MKVTAKISDLETAGFTITRLHHDVAHVKHPDMRAIIGFYSDDHFTVSGAPFLVVEFTDVLERYNVPFTFGEN